MQGVLFDEVPILATIVADLILGFLSFGTPDEVVPDVVATSTKNFLSWLPFLGTSISKMPLSTTSVTVHKLPWVATFGKKMAHFFIMGDFWWLVLG